MSRIIAITALLADGSIEIEEEFETLDLVPLYTREMGQIPADYVRVPSVDRRKRVVRDPLDIRRITETLAA